MVVFTVALTPGRGEALEAARALSSQRDHVVACATRDKNRLRAVLLESCPALEAAVDLSDRRWLELLAGFGGAWGIARSGAGGPRVRPPGRPRPPVFRQVKIDKYVCRISTPSC